MEQCPGPCASESEGRGLSEDCPKWPELVRRPILHRSVTTASNEVTLNTRVLRLNLCKILSICSYTCMVYYMYFSVILLSSFASHCHWPSEWCLWEHLPNLTASCWIEFSPKNYATTCQRCIIILRIYPKGVLTIYRVYGRPGDRWPGDR